MNISRLPAAEQDSVCCDAIVRDTAGARADLLTAGVRPLAALNGITVTGGTLDIGALMNVPANTPPAPNALANVPASIGAGGRVDLTWSDQSANELGTPTPRQFRGRGPPTACAPTTLPTARPPRTKSA